MDHRNRVILNIGGTRFEANKHTLRKVPATRLSRLSENLPNFDPVLNEYFFDRHPGVFPQVLNYYRTGKLHYPTNVCGPLFEEELAFWGLDPNQVEPCCWMTYTKHRTTEETLAALDRIEKNEISSPIEIRNRFGYSQDPITKLACHQRLRMWLWQVFEKPNSSLFAKIATAVSLFFIVLSVVIFNAESVPEFCGFNPAYTMDAASSAINADHHVVLAVTPTTSSIGTSVVVTNETFSKRPGFAMNGSSHYRYAGNCSTCFNSSSSCSSCRGGSSGPNLRHSDAMSPLLSDFTAHSLIVDQDRKTQHHCRKVKRALRVLDLIANVYLTVELILRWTISPDKCAFFRRIVNVIDAAASIWYFLILLVQEKFGYGNYVLDLASNVRVFRIFQVLNHHTGLRVIVASLEASAPVLWLFVFVFLIGMVIGATMVYYAERTFANASYRSELDGKSIFHWWWFAVVTATTVGYGDIYPRTEMGKLCGAYCAVVGVLAADVPMAIIVQTFSDFYKHQSVRSKLHRKRDRVRKSRFALMADKSSNAAASNEVRDKSVLLSPV